MAKSKAHRSGLAHWKDFLKDIVWLFSAVWKKHKVILSMLFVISTGIALVSLFQAYANGILVNTIVSAVGHTISTHAVIFALTLLGISLIIPSFLYTLQNFFEKEVYFFLTKYFDLFIAERRLLLDVEQYEDTEFNNFVNRVNEKGVFVISNLITNLFYNYQSIVTIIVASLVIAHYSLIVFIAVFASSIPQLIVSTQYGKQGWYIWSDTVDSEDRRKYWAIKGAIEKLSSLIEIKLFGLGNSFISRLQKFIEGIEKKQLANEKKYLLWQLGTMFLSQGVLLVSIIFFTYQAIHGVMQVGTVIFVFGGMVGFQNAISGLFTSLGRQQEDRMYVHDLATFLKTQGRMQDGTEELIASTSPEIHFENVSFAYPGSGTKVYQNLSLKIPSGEKLAIVGLNGAGKTTLIKLLCRFYDPQEGTLFVGGKDLRTYKRDSWYRHLGVLFQDFAEFHFPKVGELISFGDSAKEYNPEKVTAAAHDADALFVEKWKDTYGQQLGSEFKNGVEPSGGQWQKLALARLFYRNPNIWVLDEPTSAIDADAEAKIFESLAKLPKEKTVILISHRFSTVRTADRIIVIDEGKVREDGTHEELMKLDGEYARLFNLQAKGYK